MLDAGIFIYAIIIIAIVITGGFHFNYLGISVSATRLGNPLWILVFLSIFRLFISIEKKSAILLICSVFFSLGMMEIFLRVWNPPLAGKEAKQIHRASPVLGWDLIPDAFGGGKLGELYQINTAGFRDRDVKVERKEGVCRIMAIGDSFTFGLGVNLEATYPKQVEDILNEKGFHVK